MFEENASGNGPSLLAMLRRKLSFDERQRFLLLFLMINVLIFLLIWLSWHNQALVREQQVLGTQLVIAKTGVVEVGMYEVCCSDRMSALTPMSGIGIARMVPTYTRTSLSPPVVSGITPAATVQDSGHAFPIKIIGQNFGSGVTARLGANIPITVTSNTTTTVTGVLSPDAPVGVYTLTVTNPDDQPTTLSPVFIMQVSDSMLESSVLVVFGGDVK